MKNYFKSEFLKSSEAFRFNALYFFVIAWVHGIITALCFLQTHTAGARVLGLVFLAITGYYLIKSLRSKLVAGLMKDVSEEIGK